MSVDLERKPARSDAHLEYRALCSAAVASLILGVLSCLALLDWIWLAMPLAGLVVGLYAWLQIRSRPDELTGLALARAGLVLSLVFMTAGASWQSYVWTTEVPAECERISYDDLQPNPDRPANQIPQTAKALDGKKVFIKGYIYPGAQKDGIKQFLLVRDQGDCCFGGDPKITDRVQVTLVDPLRLTYKPRLHKVAGTFRVQPAPAIDGKGGVLYQLEADHLQ